jgi:GT2 family glycosyltransferase
LRSGSTSAYLIAARIAARLRPSRRRKPLPGVAVERPHGISVVIPSRNGRDLLAAQLSGIVQNLSGIASEIIVADNGSSDGTAEWLKQTWPAVRTVVSAAPLSFARAVNSGILVARFRYVCLLNNDMLVEPAFFGALLEAFRRVPDLFCATAQIHFPAGVRREETGKAVMAQDHPEDFPLRCDNPLAGEDLTWVLYGSGGCSLYDAAKLHALGNLDEAFEPAYVEDLDLGYRGWLRGWPTVYVAGAAVEHRHRATTSRYYTEAELQCVVEVNYLKFLARAIVDEGVFRRLWNQAIDRLDAIRSREPAADYALRRAWWIALSGGERIEPAFKEEWLLALTDGSCAVFPGKGNDVLLQASDRPLATPAAELLDRYAEVILIRGPKDGPAVHAASELTAAKWPGRRVLTSASG